MPQIATGGATIAWQEHGPDDGDGTPLLLVMGLRFSSAMWYPVLPALARHHRVITLDNRGVGASSPSRGFSVADMVDDACAVLDAAGVDRAHVFGCSMGGGIALEMGISRPERVRSLVLGCVGAKTEVTPPPGPMARALTHLPIGIKIRLARTMYGVDCDPAARDHDLAMLRRDPVDQASVLGQVRAVGAYSTTLEQVAAVTAPTLVLHGDADKAVPVEGGRQLAATIPGARIVEYPGAAHNFLVQYPDETARDVVEFLAGVDADQTV